MLVKKKTLLGGSLVVKRRSSGRGEIKREKKKRGV